MINALASAQIVALVGLMVTVGFPLYTPLNVFVHPVPSLTVNEYLSIIPNLKSLQTRRRCDGCGTQGSRTGIGQGIYSPENLRRTSRDVNVYSSLQLTVG